MTRNATMTARELRAGDIYRPKGRTEARRVRSIRKIGAFVVIGYDYKVLDERRCFGYANRYKWHRQAIEPLERLHVNKTVSISNADRLSR